MLNVRICRHKLGQNVTGPDMQTERRLDSLLKAQIIQTNVTFKLNDDLLSFVIFKLYEIIFHI